MDSIKDQIDRTLTILFSETSNVRLLAEISGFSPHDLFLGADFRGADLSGQDLRGLIFLEADFRSANLDRVTFDKGAFNSSYLDLKYAEYQDEFFLTPLEFLEIWPKVRFFAPRARFRPNFLDSLFVLRRVVFSTLAQMANISINPLRRARLGDTVSGLTAFNVLTAICDVLGDESAPSKYGIKEHHIKEDYLRLNTPSISTLEQWGEETHDRGYLHLILDNYINSAPLELI